jgi:hypothetical protein
MKRLALIMMTLIAPLLAADEVARKLVEVKYRDANALRDLVSNFGIQVRSDDRLKALVLMGSPEAVNQAEAAIKKLDVPAPLEKNIELLAYMVMASNEPQSGPEPADLAAVIKQMRTLFPYKSYRLLDTIWVRTKAGGGSFESRGLAPASLKVDPNFTPTYLLSSRGAWHTEFENSSIRFAELNLTLTLRESTVIKIGSNVDVREGQKVVIGKTNPTGGDSAVVLVVTAKVVD